MATSGRNRRLEPAYKQHTAVDDKVGVILDVVVTAGQTNEGEIIEPQVDEVSRTTALLRAPRRRERWSVEDRRLYRRHRCRSEGFHGEAQTWHGLARAVR